MLRGVLVATLLGGCGAASAPAVAPAQAGPHAHVGLASSPPIGAPGEHMTYKLSLQGIDLATFDYGIGSAVQLDGHQALVVASHAKAIGIVKAVANIDDYFTSWVDTRSGRPLRWMADEFATNGKDRERTEADFDRRTGDVVPVMFHLDDDTPKPEPQTVTLPEVWDYNAFLLALRGWEAPRGSTFTAEVMRSRFMWHVVMTIGAKESIVTQLGQLPALRLEGDTYKLDRDATRSKGSDERHFTIWISDDQARVPLQVTARTDYGDIKMEIVDYTPGGADRSGDD